MSRVDLPQALPREYEASKDSDARCMLKLARPWMIRLRFKLLRLDPKPLMTLLDVKRRPIEFDDLTTALSAYEKLTGLSRTQHLLAGAAVLTLGSAAKAGWLVVRFIALICKNIGFRYK